MTLLLLCPFCLSQNVPGAIYRIRDVCVWPATRQTRAGCSTGGPGDQSLCEGNWMPAGCLCVSGTAQEQREKLVSTHLYRSLHNCHFLYLKQVAFNAFMVSFFLWWLDSQSTRSRCTRTQIWPGVFCCRMLLSRCGATSSTVTKQCGLCSPTLRVPCGTEPTSMRRLSARNLRICSRW